MSGVNSKEVRTRRPHSQRVMGIVVMELTQVWLRQRRHSSRSLTMKK